MIKIAKKTKQTQITKHQKQKSLRRKQWLSRNESMEGKEKLNLEGKNRGIIATRKN